MVKVVKITDETHEDLQKIQRIIIRRGTKIFPPEFRWIVEKMKEPNTYPATYKVIISISVKFLRDLMEKIDEAHSKAEQEMNKENQTK
ncbi:hypothetical protein ES702_00455 [subsurface metagenome]